MILLGLLANCSTIGAEYLTCSDPYNPIVYYIAKKEGYSKNGSLPYRLHNPGSLIFAHQHHATRHHSGFAQFDTALAGWNELDRDVTYKLKHHIKLHKGWKYL